MCIEKSARLEIQHIIEVEILKPRRHPVQMALVQEMIMLSFAYLQLRITPYRPRRLTTLTNDRRNLHGL